MTLAPLSRAHALPASASPPLQAEFHITAQLMSSVPAVDELFAQRCLRIQTHEFIISLQSHYDCDRVAAGAFVVDCELFQVPSDS